MRQAAAVVVQYRPVLWRGSCTQKLLCALGALVVSTALADNIGYALKVAGVPRAERMARIAKVADTLGLTEYLDRLFAQIAPESIHLFDNESGTRVP